MPSCMYPPEHCGKCPPWTCAECGEKCSAEDLCSCWTSLEGMNLADLKAVFAASDMSLSLPNDSRA